MKNLHRTGITVALLGLAACDSGSASQKQADFGELATRVSAINDRDALNQAIVDTVSQAEGSTIDPATQAKLDVIEARVDELDGLIYRVVTDEGATLKFFEPSPGEVIVAFIGPEKVGEPLSMKGLTLVEIYQRAMPGTEVPTVLREAAEREARLIHHLVSREESPGKQSSAELVELASTVVQPAPGASGGVDKHLLPHHDFISNSNWESHCYEYGTPCYAGLKGAKTYTSSDAQYGWEWRYMLNVRDPNGTALGTIMTGTFSTVSLGKDFECSHYQDYCDTLFFDSVRRTVGPIVSGVGDMVVVNTAAERYCLTAFLYPGCTSEGWKLAYHRGQFVAGPNAQWHLAAKTRNDAPHWSIWGNYYLP